MVVDMALILVFVCRDSNTIMPCRLFSCHAPLPLVHQHLNRFFTNRRRTRYSTKRGWGIRFFAYFLKKKQKKGPASDFLRRRDFAVENCCLATNSFELDILRLSFLFLLNVVVFKYLSRRK